MSVRRSAAAVTGALVLALTACGTGADTASDSRDSGAEPSQTSSPRAEGLDLTSLSEGDTVPASDLADLSSAAVHEAGTVKVTIGGASAGEELTGAADFGRKPAAIRFGGSIQGQDLSVVLVDKVLYIKAPGAGAKPWVKIDPDGSDQMSRMVATMLEPLNRQTDPTWMMSMSGDAKLTVTTADGDGVTFEQQLTKKQINDMATEMYGGQFEGQAQGDMTVTTTVDGDGRPVRIVVSTPAGEQTMRYSEWGSDVDISAPPKDEVGTFDTPDFSDLQTPQS
jgi:hypothetical protein